MKIPCGKVIGHGENCVIGHLCDACEEIRRLRDALERLMEVQNGPPLIRDTKEWNEAMEQACLAIGYVESAKYYHAAGGD